MKFVAEGFIFQTLSTLVNGLAENGLVVTHVEEETLGVPDAAAAPGTDDHCTAIAPPWLEFWATLEPKVTN